MDNYNFTQAVASTTWTINHGLNANGIALDIIVDNSGTLEKVIPVFGKAYGCRQQIA